MTPTLSPEAQKALNDQSVKQKFDELTNISRLAVNTLNLLCSNDITIPTAYAKPVAEIQVWLEGMHKAIQDSLNVVKELLPKDQVPPVQDCAPETKPDTTVC